MVAPTCPPQPPSVLLGLFTGTFNLILCFHAWRGLPLADGRSDLLIRVPILHSLAVGGYMWHTWMASGAFAASVSYLLGSEDWVLAAYIFVDPCTERRLATVSGAKGCADVLAALALAYAISAALAAGIAMSTGAGAALRKMGGCVPFDSGEEKDEMDEQDEKAEKAEQGQLLEPAEAISDDGEQAASPISGEQVRRCSGGDEDGGYKNDEVLPTSDHHKNGCTDSSVASGDSSARIDSGLLAMPLAWTAVATYATTFMVYRMPLVWHVRGTVAAMALCPILWEVARICWATVELKLRRNRRKVVEAAAMGATACVRLVLLLWLFSTALFGSAVELSQDRAP